MKELAAGLLAMGICWSGEPALLHGQPTPHSSSPSSDWTAVDSAFGQKGAPQSGGVMKYSFPRRDMSVTVQGITLKPALALGSWVALKQAGGGKTIAMGDLVLAEDEVGPVMAQLQGAGIEQTALHNHVLGESPRVLYMHIHAHGDALTIGRGVRAALTLTKTPLASPAAPSVTTFDLDTAAVAAAMGYKGKVNGGVYQVTVPRAGKVFEGSIEIPPSMGVATALNFQPAGGGNAVVTGDFVMTGDEVNRVIRTLLAHHIQPTGLHSHMLTESPRLFFMHFWANENSVTVARGLRAALSQMHVEPPGK